MSEHNHSFPVDASCECGVMLSDFTLSQHREIMRLRSELALERAALQQANEGCAHLRAALFSCQVETRRARLYEEKKRDA